MNLLQMRYVARLLLCFFTKFSLAQYSCTSVADCLFDQCRDGYRKDGLTGPSGNIYKNGPEKYYGCSCVSGASSLWVSWGSTQLGGESDGYFITGRTLAAPGGTTRTWLTSDIECNKCVHSRLWGYVGISMSAGLQTAYPSDDLGSGPNGLIRRFYYCEPQPCTNVCSPGQFREETAFCTCSPCPTGYYCPNGIYKYKCTTCVLPYVQAFAGSCNSMQDTQCQVVLSNQYNDPIWGVQTCTMRCGRGYYETTPCTVSTNRVCAYCNLGIDYCVGDRDATDTIPNALSIPSNPPRRRKVCPSGQFGTGGNAYTDTVCTPCTQCTATQYTMDHYSQRCGYITQYFVSTVNGNVVEDLDRPYQVYFDNYCRTCQTLCPAVNQFISTPCNYYSDIICSSCANGFLCNGTHQTFCPIGKYCIDNTVYNCPAYTYNNATGKTSCQSCPALTMSNSLFTECIAVPVCQPGTYWNYQQSLCTKCPGGKYTDISNQDTCKSCTGGTAVNAAQTGCEGCGSGYYAGILSCVLCGTCEPGATPNNKCYKLAQPVYDPIWDGYRSLWQSCGEQPTWHGLEPNTCNQVGTVDSQVKSGKCIPCSLPCASGFIIKPSTCDCMAPNGYYFDATTSSLQPCLPGKVYMFVLFLS